MEWQVQELHYEFHFMEGVHPRRRAKGQNIVCIFVSLIYSSFYSIYFYILTSSSNHLTITTSTRTHMTTRKGLTRAVCFYFIYSFLFILLTKLFSFQILTSLPNHPTTTTSTTTTSTTARKGPNIVWVQVCFFLYLIFYSFY